jgi:hypothetical protein
MDNISANVGSTRDGGRRVAGLCVGTPGEKYGKCRRIRKCYPEYVFIRRPHLLYFRLGTLRESARPRKTFFHEPFVIKALRCVALRCVGAMRARQRDTGRAMAVVKADGLALNNLGGSEMDPPQECKEAAWGHIGAAWRSVARRVVQVSTLRNYARCHIPRWYGVTRLPPDERGSNPATDSGDAHTDPGVTHTSRAICT